MISYHRAQNDEELHQILQLQQQNLSSNLVDTEQTKEGFVTVHHTFDILKKMNAVCPHCIAKAHTKVVGYALCMDQSFKNEIAILKPMFKEIDIAFSNKETQLSNYIAMGQICIDKDSRKKGVFRGLYDFMKKELRAEYSCIITEVDAKNIRSSMAHKAVGFELLKTYVSNNITWELILLEF